MAKVQVNDRAPIFSCLTDTGESFSLSDHLGKANIALYFYPQDFGVACTIESCAFRDNWGAVQSLGATVVGVDSNTINSHKAFKKENSLPFSLLSDKDSKIRELYGVKDRFVPPRVTFVIDNQGVIRDVFNNPNPTKHVEHVLEVLKNMPQSQEKK